MADIPQQKMVLFVDDEKEWIEAYMYELQACKIEARFIRTIDDADKFLQKNFDHVALLILDIMMPPGRIFSPGETDLGLRTGVKFYERIRKMAPELPIILLANVRDEKVKERFLNEPHCWFLSKRGTFPHELVDKVQLILKSKEKKK